VRHDIKPLSWQNHVPMKDGTRADRLKLDIVLLLSGESFGKKFEVISARCTGCTLSWLFKL
jgi:hypothetical protein